MQLVNIKIQILEKKKQSFGDNLYKKGFLNNFFELLKNFINSKKTLNGKKKKNYLQKMKNQK